MVKRVILVLLLAAGCLAGGIWLGGHPRHLPTAVRDQLVQDTETQRFNDALQVVRGTFYRDVPEKQLVADGIGGMVKQLKDPYSQYFTPEDYKKFLRQQAQQFSGIGVAVGADKGGLRILKSYPNSPAQEAGLKLGDLIVSADGKPLKGLKQERAVALVKGPEGTTVLLGIQRKATKARKVRVTRRAITVPSVGSRFRTYRGKTFQQIAVGVFSQDDVTEQVEEQIRRGEKRRVAGIVLDLRGNPGGLVTEAQGVAGTFLSKGDVIVSTRGRSVAGATLRAQGAPEAPKIPMVVLVDRGSASASEIVAGALQDHRRAKLVGVRTYGKGVFQQVINLRDGGALDLTAGEYFTPNGRNLGAGGSKRGAGLTPDVRVPGDWRTRQWQTRALATALKTLAAETK